MKKYRALTILLICSMAFSLASCSSNGGEAEVISNVSGEVSASSDESKEEALEGEKDQYYYVYNNVKIVPNSNIENVLAEVKEEYEYFETNSCAYQGKDKVYTFSNFIISTYPSDDGDFISSIEITSDAISTSEGVYIGDSMDKVKSVYGDNFEDSGTSLTYKKGDTAVSFISDGDVVGSILYMYPDLAQ